MIACSLTAQDLPERRRRWLALADRALTDRETIPGGIRLTFRSERGIEQELRALARLERDCCGFAAFDVSASHESVTLDVTSSGDGVAAARALFA